MKKEIHPSSYKFVVFRDITTGFSVLTRSTVDVGDKPEMVTWEDGTLYPLHLCEISLPSHDFYSADKSVTRARMVDLTARFNAKFNRKVKKK